jgi:hypothetical protein
MAQLQDTVNCNFLCDVNHQCQTMSELCVEPLWYGEQPIAIARQLDSLIYLYTNKFKALNTLLNSAEYTIKREKVFLFLCPKLLLGHSNR